MHAAMPNVLASNHQHDMTDAGSPLTGGNAMALAIACHVHWLQQQFKLARSALGEVQRLINVVQANKCAINLVFFTISNNGALDRCCAMLCQLCRPLWVALASTAVAANGIITFSLSTVT